MTLQQFIIRILFSYSILLAIAIMFHELGHYMAIKLLDVKYKTFIDFNENEDGLISSKFGFEIDNSSKVKTILVSLTGILYGLSIISLFFLVFMFNAVTSISKFISAFILTTLLFALYSWGCWHDIKLMQKSAKFLYELELKKNKKNCGG